MADRLSEMTDNELHNEVFNCDAFDQDEIAAELFLELWTRYEGKRDECKRLKLGVHLLLNPEGTSKERSTV